jgi:phosphate transport system protein
VRVAFHQQLRAFQEQIIDMGQLVVQAIENATLSLARQDVALARQVLERDAEIDRRMLDIQKQAMQLIGLQQPMARDLRLIGTGMKIVTDLERVGDQATNIAEITLKLADEPLFKPLVDIPRMAEMATAMVRDALAAYVDEDENRARAMIQRDDAVDGLYRALFDELLAIMEREPDKVRQATYLLHVAGYLERVADHATNLGEWTIYMLTGELEELNN